MSPAEGRCKYWCRDDDTYRDIIIKWLPWQSPSHGANSVDTLWLKSMNKSYKQDYCTLNHVMSLSVTAYPFPCGRGVLLLEQSHPSLSQGKGRVLPGQVASSSQGPHWWAMWGSVSCSKTLRHAAQPCPEPGFELATFRSLVDLLYPLSYSRPVQKMILIFFCAVAFHVRDMLSS